MLSEIRKVVSEELRGASLIGRFESSPEPMPCDLRAEDQLLHLALTGKLDVASGSILASEFFSALNAQLWVAAEAVQATGAKVTGGALMSCLEANGQAVTDSVRVEVEELFIPMAIDGTPGELRERVQEKARARKLIDWMGRMQSELRTGTSSSGDVRNKMARWAKGAENGKSEGGHGPGVRDSRVRDVA